MRREKGTLDMKFDIVRAWKDESYRQQLSSEEQALLPANPAGELELSDAELQAVQGAHGEFEVSAVQGCSYGNEAQCVSIGSQASDCKVDNYYGTISLVGITVCS
jgi:mersacidin/lichenicidin family type 2 lantibiotic